MAAHPSQVTSVRQRGGRVNGRVRGALAASLLAVIFARGPAEDCPGARRAQTRSFFRGPAAASPGFATPSFFWNSPTGNPQDHLKSIKTDLTQNQIGQTADAVVIARYNTGQGP
ncbi:hypothetical protein JCM9957A_35220 [Kineosporia succinea]